MQAIPRLRSVSLVRPPSDTVAAGGGDWRCGAITRCRCERNRAVLATSSDRDLADGVAFAFGGAVPARPPAATSSDRIALLQYSYYFLLEAFL